MLTRITLLAVSMLACPLPATSAQSVTWSDPSPHSVRLVAVEDGVELEVLDWGGEGPPIVLLAGLGNTAHVFDGFAPKLTKADPHWRSSRALMTWGHGADEILSWQKQPMHSPGSTRG